MAEATEIAPSEYALAALWEGTTALVNETAGGLADVRAVHEWGDGTINAADTFTASNGTAINGRTLAPTDPGANWVASANYTIESNAAETSATSADEAIVDLGALSQRVFCDVTWGFAFGTDGTEWNGLALRADNAGNYLVFQPVGWDGTRLYKLIDQDGAIVASFHPCPAALAATSGASNNVEIDCTAAGQIKCKIDGVEVGSYSLSAAEALIYGAAGSTFFGLYSNEQSATPVGNFDNFQCEALDNDGSALRATAAGVVRYFSFRPPVLADGEILELASVYVKQKRSSYGLWKIRFGALDAKGDPIYAESPGAAMSIVRTSVNEERTSAEATRLLNGQNFDDYDPLGYFVKLESITEDADQTFGNADLTEVRLRLRRNARPVVTADAVDVTTGNPIVSWTYSDAEGDPQSHYDVRAILPSVIAADPTANLEDLTAAYESGFRAGQADRSHRVTDVLTAATSYTFAIRVSQRVGGRRVDSEWDTIDATTAAAVETTPTVVATAGLGEASLAIDDLGAATRVNIWRAEHATAPDVTATGVLIASDVAVTVERTLDSIDSFDRAGPGLGNEEGTNTRTWVVDTGVSTTSGTTIVSNSAQIDGDGAATVPVGATDVAVSALVDVTLAPGGVRVRGGASGEVDAVVGADLVELRSFTGGGTPHAANTTSVAHSTAGDTISIQLIASGDDYFVLLNGELVIWNNDATVPSKAETGAGIAAGGYTGTHRIDYFEARLLDSTIAYVDVPPQGILLEYGIVGLVRDTSPDANATAMGVSNEVTVTAGTWRLRAPLLGVSLAFDPEDLDVKQDRPGETTSLLDGGVQARYAAPYPRHFKMGIRTTNKTDFDTLESLLALTGDLGLSDVYGTSWTVRNASDVKWDHVASEPETGEGYAVRHHWVARVQFQEV